MKPYLYQSRFFRAMLLIVAMGICATPVIAQPVSEQPPSEQPPSEQPPSEQPPSEQPSVSAKASRQTVQVAEPFSVNLSVTVPNGAEVTFPPLPKTIGDLLIVDHKDLSDLPGNSTDERIWTRRITLESLIGGEQTFPAQEIQVRVAGNWRTLRTDPVTINVTSVVEQQTDPKQYRDIQSVVDVKAREDVSFHWVWWTIASTAIGSMAVAMVIAMTRRRSWMSPQQWAIDELDHLKSEIHGQEYAGEYVANELPRILKEYLEMQFEVAAPAHTTGELMQWIRRRLGDPSLPDRFEQLFAFADEVKFAGLAIDDAELIDNINQAEQLIETTADMTAMSDSAQQENV